MRYFLILLAAALGCGKVEHTVKLELSPELQEFRDKSIAEQKALKPYDDMFDAACDEVDRIRAECEQMEDGGSCLKAVDAIGYEALQRWKRNRKDVKWFHDQVTGKTPQEVLKAATDLGLMD